MTLDLLQAVCCQILYGEVSVQTIRNLLPNKTGLALCCILGMIGVSLMIVQLLIIQQYAVLVTNDVVTNDVNYKLTN